MLIQSPCVRLAAQILSGRENFSSEIHRKRRLDSYPAPAENHRLRWLAMATSFGEAGTAFAKHARTEIGGLDETVATSRRRHFAEPRARVAVRVERLCPAARKRV